MNKSAEFKIIEDPCSASRTKSRVSLNRRIDAICSCFRFSQVSSRRSHCSSLYRHFIGISNNPDVDYARLVKTWSENSRARVPLSSIVTQRALSCANRATRVCFRTARQGISDVKESQRIFSRCFIDHRIRFHLLCNEFHSTASSSCPSCTIVWFMTRNAGISSSIKITGARFVLLAITKYQVVRQVSSVL